MRLAFALLSSLLLAAPAAAAPMVAPTLSGPDAVDRSSYARPAEARVTHVALDLTADFAAKRMSGSATLDLAAAPGAREIVLDSRGLDIRSVTDGQGRALAWTLGKAEGDRGALA